MVIEVPSAHVKHISDLPNLTKLSVPLTHYVGLCTASEAILLPWNKGGFYAQRPKVPPWETAVFLLLASLFRPGPK